MKASNFQRFKFMEKFENKMGEVNFLQINELCNVNCQII